MARAHLNGSLNLADTETVFRTVAEISGESVARIPDGETGPRLGWIAALVPHFRESTQLVEGTREVGYTTQPVFSLAEGVTPEELVIPALGYAEAAREAWPIFRRLRDDGVIAPATRFQVSLPTVTAGVAPFFAPEAREPARPAYARQLRSELDEILALVPADDLAIQWDVAVEMGMVEGAFPMPFDPFEMVVGQLAELSSWVPAAVPLGYHLCYGDAQEVPGEGEGRHWKEPADTAMLVRVANALSAAAARPLQWFSFPVPIDRSDDAYFEPLSALELGDDCELYLGLVHHQDGVEGTQRRVDAAKRHVERFGVATECGMGRKPRELVTTLLGIQRDVVV
jgi:hypothetical protein